MTAPNGESALLDFDGWLGRQDDDTRNGIQSILNVTEEGARDARKQRIAAIYGLAEMSNIEPAEVHQNWDAIRSGFAVQQGGEFLAVKDDDAGFIGVLRAKATKQRDERQLVFGPDDVAQDASDSLLVRAREAAYKGDGYPSALADWQATAKGKPGYDPARESIYAEQAATVHREMWESVEKVRPVADAVFAQLSADRGTGPAVEDGGEVAKHFRGLTPDEKRLTFRLMADWSKGESDKLRSQAFWEAVGRGGENLFVGGSAAAFRSGLLAAKFREGDIVTRDHPAQEVLSDLASQTGDEGASLGRSVEKMARGRKLTAEEAKTWNAQLAEAIEDLDTGEELRKFGAETIDPTQTGGAFFRKLVLPVADSAAIMSSMMLMGNPVASLAMRARGYQNDEYLKLRSQGMDAQEADDIATVTGAAQAGLDQLSFGILKGFGNKFLPATSKALQQFAITGSGAARFGLNTSTTLAAEIGVELTQDHVIPALVQDLCATDPAFDVKWGDVWRDAAAAAPDVALGMVLLAGAGGTAQTLAQGRSARELGSSKAAMRARGYSLEQIEEITAAPEAARPALLAEYLPAKAPRGEERKALIAEAIPLAREEQAAFDARTAAETVATGEAADYAIRVTRNGDGWQVTKQDGATVTVDTVEAARRIREDLRQASTQEEAAAFVAITDAWHDKAGEGTTRETTFTGETVQSDGQTVSRTRGIDVVAEEMDARTLETLRSEALMDAQASGTEAIAVMVHGSNKIEFIENVAGTAREVVQRLELNQSESVALTAIHEQIEATWRTGVAQGTITRDETVSAVRAVANALDPAMARNPEERAFRERVQRVAEGTGSETELRETVSELVVAEIIGRRKDGTAMPAGSVTAAVDAALQRATDAAELTGLKKFRALLRATRQWFRAVFGTVAALKKARRKGETADFDALIDKLLGLEQPKYDAELSEEVLTYIEPTSEEMEAGVAFSVRKVSTTEDRAYLEAVESGNIDAARKMVDDAAIAAGFAEKGFHGSPNADIETFSGEFLGLNTDANSALKGFFHTNSTVVADGYRKLGEQGLEHLDPETLPELIETMEADLARLVDAESYESAYDFISQKTQDEAGIGDESAGEAIPLLEDRIDQLKAANFGKRYENWLRYSNPLITDANGKRASEIFLTETIDEAIAAGNDAVIVKNVQDNWDGSFETSTVTVVFSSDQVASSDPVLRDASGKVVPLSARFSAPKTFRVTAGNRLELVMKQLDDALAKDPKKRRELQAAANQKLQKLQFDAETERFTPQGDVIRPLVDQRTAEQLDKEQAFIQADRAAELIASGMSKREANNAARESAYEWRQEQDAMQKKDWRPRAKLVRDLRTLDAVLSVFPPEVRGKVGGFVKLATLASDAARAKEIERRIRKLSILLERHLKDETTEALDELLERAKPDREAGKQSRGKLGAEAHRYFDSIHPVLTLTSDEVEAKRAALDTAMAAPDLTSAQALDLFEQQQILDTFGAWKEKTAAEMDAALTAAQAVYDTGRNKRRMVEEARLEDVAAKAQQVIDTLGGVSDERIQNQQERAKTVRKKISNTALDLSSFAETLEVLLGAGHPLAEKWTRAVRDGFAKRNDRIRDLRKRWKEAIETATGQKGVKARRALWDMGQKQTLSVERAGKTTGGVETVPITVIEQWRDGTATPDTLGFTPDEADTLIADLAAMDATDRRENLPINRATRGAKEAVPMTEAQGIFLTMLGAQEQYQEALSRDGWDADTLAEIESQLSPAARQLRQFMRQEYADGYAPLATIFERMYGVALPQIRNYAPASFYHVGAERATGPEDGSGTAGGMRAGFLANRKRHTAAPRLENAFATFFGHVNQTAHWQGLAEVVREISGVLGKPDVKKAIIGAHGEHMLKSLNDWVRNIEGSGLQQQSGHIDKAVSWLTSQQAYIALAFNLGTLMKQSSAILGAAYRMPLGSYAHGMAKLLSGKLETGKLYAHPMIQRRLESGFAPEVRAALNNIWSAKPTRRAAILEAGMEMIGFIDALFTTGSAAIAYDYHLQQAQAAGLEGAAAENFALREVEDMIGRTAQPADAVDRSLFEARLNPFGRLMFLFASEARQKSSLWLTAWRNTLTGKATAQDYRTLALLHFVVAPMMQAITAAWRDARDDDDDELFDAENWDPMDFAIAAAVGPLSGIPLIGEALSGFSGSGPLSGIVNAVKTTGKLFDGPEERDAEPVEWYVKRVTRIMQGMDAFTGVTGKLLDHSFSVLDNVLPDSESEEQKKLRAAVRRERKERREAAE